MFLKLYGTEQCSVNFWVRLKQTIKIKLWFIYWTMFNLNHAFSMKCDIGLLVISDLIKTSSGRNTGFRKTSGKGEGK